MDAGVLTTLGSAVGVVLSLLGIIAPLRREIIGEIREVRFEIRVLDDRVRDLQMDMRIVKRCLEIGGTPLCFEGADRISVLAEQPEPADGSTSDTPGVAGYPLI